MSNLLDQTRSEAFVAAALALNEAELEYNRITPSAKTSRIRITINFDLSLYSIYAEIKVTIDYATKLLAVDAIGDIGASRFAVIRRVLSLVEGEYSIDDVDPPEIIIDDQPYAFDNEGIGEEIPAISDGGIKSISYQSNPNNISYELDIKNLLLKVFATIPINEPQITATGGILIAPKQYP